MAHIGKFIEDKSYRRDILSRIELKMRYITNKNENSGMVSDFLDPVVKINDIIGDNLSDSVSEDDLSDSVSEDEFEDRDGDDFEIDQLHRYETNIINILKYLVNKNNKYTNMKITHLHFVCTKKDFDVKIGNKYVSEWLYVINIKMLIDKKLVDYHSISHHISKYYKNAQHILAVDDKILFDVQDDAFYIN